MRLAGETCAAPLPLCCHRRYSVVRRARCPPTRPLTGPKLFHATYRDVDNGRFQLEVAPERVPTFAKHRKARRGSLALRPAGTQIDIIVQVFNLLNNQSVVGAATAAVDPDGEVVELSDERGPVFALPISYQRGRTFEVGLRFRF